MAGNGIVEVTDANFDQDVLKSGQARAGGFLGDVVRTVRRAIAPIVGPSRAFAEQYKGTKMSKVGKMDVTTLTSATPACATK